MTKHHTRATQRSRIARWADPRWRKRKMPMTASVDASAYAALLLMSDATDKPMNALTRAAIESYAKLMIRNGKLPDDVEPEVHDWLEGWAAQ